MQQTVACRLVFTLLLILILLLLLLLLLLLVLPSVLRRRQQPLPMTPTPGTKQDWSATCVVVLKVRSVVHALDQNSNHWWFLFKYRC